MNSGWAGYLDHFHTDRPGITERILRHAAGADADAYSWLVAAASDGVILDVACGSAPLWPHLPGRNYVGLDVNAAELAVAQARGALVVRASAAALPLPTASVDVVACSMALQVVQPLRAVLEECVRVLRPDGTLIATMPAAGPLRGGDRPLVAGLLGALGRRLRYPNDTALAHLPDLLTDVGLRLTADESRRFAYPMRTAADADLFLAGLYLPGVTASRYQAARCYLRLLARARTVLPVPIRRIVATRE